MTKEKVIEELLCMKHFVRAESDADKALDMVIEALQENESLAKSLNDAVKLIHKLQKKNEWIPCSERLPEQDGEYLVTAISDMRTLPFIMITSFFKDSNYGKNHWHTGWSKSEVIAWMPLPEPYKENES